jgi:hypothetical protein
MICPTRAPRLFVRGGAALSHKRRSPVTHSPHLAPILKEIAASFKVPMKLSASSLSALTGVISLLTAIVGAFRAESSHLWVVWLVLGLLFMMAPVVSQVAPLDRVNRRGGWAQASETPHYEQ